MENRIISRALAGPLSSRITESKSKAAVKYIPYDKTMLEKDLSGDFSVDEDIESRAVFTELELPILHSGEVVVSLANLKAAIAGPSRKGFFLTSNFAILDPAENVCPAFLVYLINEDQGIRKKLLEHSKGSILFKVTIRDLERLQVPNLPDFEKQKRIGETYLALKKQTALQNRKIRNQERVVLELLKKTMEQSI